MQNILAKIKFYWQKPRTKWIVGILVGLYLVYVAVGLFSLPGIIQNQAQQFVSEKFKRNVSIGSVSFNPLTLTAQVDDLHFSEPNKQEDFLSFDHLTLDLSIQSLFRLAPVIEEVRVVNPKVHLIRTGSNQYNIDDLIAYALKPKEDDSPTRFSINNIQIENAQLVFDDQPIGRHHVIDQFNLTIPFISNIPSKVDTFVDLALSGRVDGDPIVVEGQARPFFKERDGSFNLKLKGINLTQYVDYLPFKPNFILRSARLSIDLHLGFEQSEQEEMQLSVGGNVTLNDLAIAQLDGKVAVQLPQLSLDLAKSNILAQQIDIDRIVLERPQIHLSRNRAGQWNLQKMAEISVSGKNELEQSEVNKQSQSNMVVDLKSLSIQDGNFDIEDLLQIVPTNFKVNHFALNVEGVHFDMQQRNATVEKISSDSTQISFVHGLLNHQKPLRSQSTSDSSEAFNFSIAQLQLKNWSVNFENKYKGHSWKTQLENFNVAVDNISSDFSQPITVKSDTLVNHRGKASLEGTVAISPLKTDLNLDFSHVDVRFVQPYIEDFVNLSINTADFSTKGKLQLAKNAKGELSGKFTGDAALSNLVTIDQLTKRPFVNWKDLRLHGLKFNLSPLDVNVDHLTLNGLVARVILNADGHLNVQDILRSAAGGQRSLTENNERKIQETQTEQVPATEENKKSEPLNYSIKVAKSSLVNGRIQFSDNFIRPRYTANLLNLNGTVTGLSTDANKQAGVNIHGRVNGAPLVIGGLVNPLSQELSLDLQAKVKGMELAQFSSYSGKYIGYGIQKGKLSFDVAYKIVNRQLSAENKLVLDQLTLGEKVKSDSATSLPVSLALALLKDRHGVIDLNLPIGGSLDDPEFSVGGIILKMFVNLITKAVTSPFTLLSSLVGDGEELSWIAFNPGTDVLPASEIKKLESLVKALTERPGLNLEITGTYDPSVDGPGLAKRMIQRKAREAKRKQTGNVVAEKVEVSDNDYNEALKQVYKNSKFEKPAYWFGMNKSLSSSEMEKLVGKHYSPSLEEYQRLTAKRAEVAKAWLIAHGIPEERLFILAGRKSNASAGSGNRVDFSLH